jgi:hypothetical protein
MQVGPLGVELTRDVQDRTHRVILMNPVSAPAVLANELPCVVAVRFDRPWTSRVRAPNVVARRRLASLWTLPRRAHGAITPVHGTAFVSQRSMASIMPTTLPTRRRRCAVRAHGRVLLVPLTCEQAAMASGGAPWVSPCIRATGSRPRPGSSRAGSGCGQGALPLCAVSDLTCRGRGHGRDDQGRDRRPSDKRCRAEDAGWPPVCGSAIVARGLDTGRDD